MASSEMKHLRDKLEKEATEEHLMGTIAKDDGSAPLVCDECGSQNCEYQTTVRISPFCGANVFASHFLIGPAT